jgi:hypothetical protein
MKDPIPIIPIQTYNQAYLIGIALRTLIHWRQPLKPAMMYPKLLKVFPKSISVPTRQTERERERKEELEIKTALLF